MRYENEFQLRACNFKESTVVLTADIVNIKGNQLDYDRDRIEVHWPELLERGVEFGDEFKVRIERIERQ